MNGSGAYIYSENYLFFNFCTVQKSCQNEKKENRENDEEHNDDNDDENYDYITNRSFEASKLQGFCNRNRNFNIRLRKFNYGYDLRSLKFILESMTTLVYMKHKYQINLVLVLVFQLFAYILQQFKYLKLPEKTIAIKSKYLSNYSIKVSRNQFLYKFISWKTLGHNHLRPNQWPLFSQICGFLVKIENFPKKCWKLNMIPPLSSFIFWIPTVIHTTWFT